MHNSPISLNTLNMHLRFKASGYYAYTPRLVHYKSFKSYLKTHLPIQSEPLSGIGLQPTNHFEEMAQ